MHRTAQYWRRSNDLTSHFRERLLKLLRRLLGDIPNDCSLPSLFRLGDGDDHGKGLTIDESIKVTHGKTFFYLLTRQPAMSLFSGEMMYQTSRWRTSTRPLRVFCWAYRMIV